MLALYITSFSSRTHSHPFISNLSLLHFLLLHLTPPSILPYLSVVAHHSKHVELRVLTSWQDHQSTRSLDVRSAMVRALLPPLISFHPPVFISAHLSACVLLVNFCLFDTQTCGLRISSCLVFRTLLSLQSCIFYFISTFLTLFSLSYLYFSLLN